MIARLTTASQAIPVGDWQFWVVTAVTLLILFVALRNYIPGLRKKKTTRVSLTIDRESRKK